MLPVHIVAESNNTRLKSAEVCDRDPSPYLHAMPFVHVRLLRASLHRRIGHAAAQRHTWLARIERTPAAIAAAMRMADGPMHVCMPGAVHVGMPMAVRMPVCVGMQAVPCRDRCGAGSHTWPRQSTAVLHHINYRWGSRVGSFKA